MSERVIKGTISAWLTQYNSLSTLDYEPENLLSCVAFHQFDMKDQGWTYVGKAEITLTLVDHDQVIANKVDSLRAEQTAIRADAQKKITELNGEIQNLLAIAFDAKLEEPSNES